jgi:hypothetical protein
LKKGLGLREGLKDERKAHKESNFMNISHFLKYFSYLLAQAFMESKFGVANTTYKANGKNPFVFGVGLNPTNLVRHGFTKCNALSKLAQ